MSAGRVYGRVHRSELRVPPIVALRVKVGVGCECEQSHCQARVRVTCAGRAEQPPQTRG
jgi:hypothetical protein